MNERFSEEDLTELRERIERLHRSVGGTLDDARDQSERAVLVIGDCVTELLDSARLSTRATQDALERVSGNSPVLRVVEQQSSITDLFVSALQTQLADQKQLVARAVSQSDEIVGVAKTVGRAARKAEMLAINAQIEAARMGSEGRPFTVLAGEMADLAQQVKDANRRISELGKMLSEDMPALASGTDKLVKRGASFGDSLSECSEALRQAEAEVAEETQLALHDNESRAARTLNTAQTALSALQFQDPMSQSLRGAKKQLVEFRIEVLAANEPVPEPSPEEVQDEAAAGDVMLF